MSRAAFQAFGSATPFQSKSASSRSAPFRMEPQHDRQDSGENQVVPFYLDDGADDNEEIRRRRYSSSYSSCQDDDDRSGRRRGPSKQSQGASDWEHASSQDSSHADNDDDIDLSDDDDKHRVHVGIVASGKHRGGREEPESPRKSRRKSQQSDDEDGDEDEESKTAIKPAEKPVHGDKVGSTASALSGLDLSEISKLSVFPGSDGEALVQGHVVRVKPLLGGCQYHFFIQDRLVLLALKQLKNRTSNYHVFDMTRAVAGSSKLTKKSGNYVGKLRANFSRRKYVLVSNLRRRTELGAFEFEPTASAVEPRRLTAVLPPLSSSKLEVSGLTVGDSSAAFSVLLELLAGREDCEAARHSPIPPSELRVLESRLPTFENGYYRLNFHGRVSVPSVKNFQLVERPRGAPPHADAQICDARVLLQFGKVDAHKFHLDFRAPVTPLQAFALALAQFNF